MLGILGNDIVAFLPAVEPVSVAGIGLQCNGAAVPDVLAGGNGAGIVMIFLDGDIAVDLLKGCRHVHILCNRGDGIPRIGGNNLILVLPANELVPIVRRGIDFAAGTIGNRTASSYSTTRGRICLHRNRVIPRLQCHVGTIRNIRILHGSGSYHQTTGTLLRIHHQLSGAVNVGTAALIIGDRPGNIQIGIVVALNIGRKAHGASLCHRSCLRKNGNTGDGRHLLLNGYR